MNLKNLFLTFFTLIISLSLTSVIIAQKKKVVATKKATTIAKGNLTVEAGLVFRLGDVKPVARANFYLLDQDLEKILADAGFQPKSNNSIGSVGGLAGEKSGGNVGRNNVESFAVWNGYPSLYGEQLQKAQEVIKSHIVSTITTDFSGKGEFSEVKTGSYFLMGVTRIGKQTVVWNMPFDLKAGKQSVVLDNNNAAAIF